MGFIDDPCNSRRRCDDNYGFYEGYGRFRFEPCPHGPIGGSDPWPWERNSVKRPFYPLMGGCRPGGGFGSSWIILLAALIRF